jgi:class 3 adenylate cyclase
MAAGDLEHRVGLVRRDELGMLATTFNGMAEKLAGSFARLRGTLAAFERFVPQKFLHVVAPEGIENIQVGTRARRTVTILFSDIRGYTSLSESTSAESMFLFLNEYLPEMGGAIEAHGGFIDKYIGDAIMALFDDDHTDGALAAALAMRSRLFALNRTRRERGEVEIDIGIGIHRGEVVMGTVGFRSKIESTVIGDAVNLASRIEGLTKQYGEGILISDAVVRGLERPERFRTRVVAEDVKVKGKGEGVRLTAVDDPETPRLSVV